MSDVAFDDSCIYEKEGEKVYDYRTTKLPDVIFIKHGFKPFIDDCTSNDPD